MSGRNAADERNVSMVCEYCDGPANVLIVSSGGGIGPLLSRDAGNETTAIFHADCHAEMMRAEICGGAETCDVESPDGDHCSCYAEGIACCGCKAVPS